VALLGWWSVLDQGVADPGGRGASAASEAALQQEEGNRVKDAVRRKVVNRWYSISVGSEESGVVLRGEVDTDATRREIYAAAQAATPRRVIDQLTLRPPAPDQEVQTALRATLQRQYPDLMRHLTVEVQGGVARLRGDLASHRQIDQVLATTVMVPGVRDIESAVTVKGVPYPREVRRQAREHSPQ
jgi:osmotically-inducible protein OsmY